MTGTPLELAVSRLERAIIRLERRPPPAPSPLASADATSDDAVALAHLRTRHERLRDQVRHAIQGLDDVIAAGSEAA